MFYYSDDDSQDREIPSFQIVTSDAKVEEPNFTHLNEEKLPQVVVIIGPPGSGKGTQSQKLVENRDFYVHLSTGDYIRKIARDSSSPLCETVKSFIEHNNLVPDELVTEAVKAFILKAHSEGKTALLDGYPRTARQAYELQQFAHVVMVLCLSLESDDCEERIAHRCYDEKTDLVYSKKNLPKDIFDIQVRPLDINPVMVKRRLVSYWEDIGSIFVYYKNQIKVINGKGSIEKVHSRLLNELDNYQPNDAAFCIDCGLTVASYMNMPCGHRRWCYKCAPKLGEDVCCNLETCSESIDKYVNLSLSNEEQDEDDVHYPITHSLANKTEDSLTVAIKIGVPDCLTRPPLNLCFCIDVSGSMSDLAKYENDKGEMITTSSTVLTVVKYAMKTVLHYLRPQDMMSIVTFSSNANLAMPFTVMDPNIVENARKTIECMTSFGSTNLWAGLTKAIDQFKDVEGNNCVMLLTDGVPDSDSNPVDIKNYLKTNSISCSINTFGFGTSLVRNLLSDIANQGNGIYTFLSDAATVGPCFVKSLASIGCTAVQNAELHLKLSKGVTFAKNPVKGIFSGDIYKPNKNTLNINLGSLLYGHSRSVIVDIDLPEGFNISQKYMQASLFIGENRVEVEDFKNGSVTSDAKVSLARAEMINHIYLAMQEESKAEHSIKTLVSKLEKLKGEHFLIETMLEEAKTRITKAVNPEKYRVWGHPYLGALKRALERQVSNNIMDKSTSIYGGTLYHAIVELCKNVYMEYSKELLKVAPPTVKIHIPTSNYSSSNYSSSYSANRTINTTTSNWGGGGGGCFSGTNYVTTDKGVKLIENLEEGELVKTSRGFAKIKHVVKINKPFYMHNVKGLLITANHPIFLDKVGWTRPFQHSFEKVLTEKMYNLVLESDHNVLINDIPCVTWGHDCKGELAHKFYGSSFTIENALAGMKKENGQVVIGGFIYDKDKHVIGFSS